MNFPFQGLLFDLDGTLVLSLDAVNRAWTTWCHYHGLDPSKILSSIHGRRAIDSIRLVAPELDAEAEHTRLEKIESEDTEGVLEMPGAGALLRSIDGVPWGIVTSGTLPVALARIEAGGFPTPPILVTGNDVERGKPAPDPFLRGAELLGVDPQDCIAFEDTAAGARSAKAAGMKVILVGDSKGDCDARVENFQSVSIQRTLLSLVIRLD